MDVGLLSDPFVTLTPSPTPTVVPLNTPTPTNVLVVTNTPTAVPLHTSGLTVNPTNIPIPTNTSTPMPPRTLTPTRPPAPTPTLVSTGSSIGDCVWLDVNRNGIQDTDEQGVLGATVYLLSGGERIAQTTTNNSGCFLFANLTSGNYALEFLPPTGYEITDEVMGQDRCSDSDPNRDTGITQETLLDPGEADMCWDMGLYLANNFELSLDLQVRLKGAQTWGQRQTQATIGDILEFRITVTNIGDKIEKLTLRDVLPTGLVLQAGQSAIDVLEEFENGSDYEKIVTVIVGEQTIAFDQELCLINIAEASDEHDNSVSDTTEVCIVHPDMRASIGGDEVLDTTQTETLRLAGVVLVLLMIVSVVFLNRSAIIGRFISIRR